MKADTLLLDEARRHYYAYKTAFAMARNPNLERSKTRKYARVAWARKIKKLDSKEVK